MGPGPHNTCPSPRDTFPENWVQLRQLLHGAPLECLISRENRKGYLGRFHPRESYPSDLSEWNGAFTKPAPGPGAPSLETGWIWPHSFWGLPLGGLVSGYPRDSYHSDLFKWDGDPTIPAPAQGTHFLKIGCSCGKFFMVLP